MYITKNLYEKILQYVDLPDLDFFKKVLNVSKKDNIIQKLMELDSEEIKIKYTPVVYFSTLSKKKKNEDLLVRKGLDWSRARRRFIMLDMDFDEGEEKLSIRTRKELISIADYYKTPILIYPTISYPKKPRFRAVLFTKRLLNESSYYQAVIWLYRQINMSDLLDKGDVSIKANRNLPIFNNYEQVDGIYSTLDDEKLEPLENSLWKNMPKPKIRKTIPNQKLEDIYTGEMINNDVLLQAIEDMKKTPFLREYNTFWMFVNSLASSVIMGEVSDDVVDDVLESVAYVSDNKAQVDYWKSENINLYNLLYERLLSDKKQLALARPLKTYTEIKNLLEENKSEEK